MKLTRAVGTAALLLSVASAAHAADPAGKWKVGGSIRGRTVALTCTFSRQGAELGGACVEAAGGDGKAGEAHPLTRGTVSGGQVGWTYTVKIMLMSFDVTYSGVLAGDRMTGTISAAGQRGQFTATRM